jgi:endonuclease/exonuclease/phosphatase family metal-dependent hydrolase
MALPSPARGSRRRLLLSLVAGVPLSVVVFVLVLVWTIAWRPPARMEVAVDAQGEASALAPGTTLTVLVWNLQFCGSRNYDFFYDEGPDVHVSPEHVEQTMAAIAEVIARHDPDLLLLQEVDRDSDRTGRVDQLQELMATCAYPRVAATPYYRVRYVPHPGHDHLGKVDMHLAVAARAETGEARRFQLPLLNEPWLRRQFNLRRAILELDVDRGADHPPLVVLNTHLAAFSKGDGTLASQVDVIRERLEALDAAGSPWILGGDLNMLPPHDHPARLGEDAKYYSDTARPIDGLLDAGYRSAFDLDALSEHPGAMGSYLPFGAEVPDRTLDYVFVSDGIEVLSAQVLTRYTDISDHLPLLVEVRIP